MYALKMKWPVFPCRVKGKEPLTPHGFKDATCDETQIRAWWTQWPNANIATPTGLGWWVLDVDPRNGGKESLEVLTEKHGRLPDTLQQMTGGDGRHYCFATVKGVRIGCGTIAPGLDYKGEGGYILLAPSIHPNGKAYTWDGLDPIDKQPILPLNLAGWNLNSSRANGKSSPNPEEPIFAGERNTRLFNQGCKMSWAGFGKEIILITLQAQNKRLCHPPLEDSEVRKIAESCGRYPPGTAMPPDPEHGPEPPPDLPPQPKSKPRREALLQAQLMIKNHPDWAGVLAYNQFSLKICALRTPPFASAAAPFVWGDIDDINTAIWLQSKRISAGTAIANQAVHSTAFQFPFHPVRDYLNALNWDKIPRIDDWLLLYLGAEQSDYNRAVGARWLIGAVARIFNPGCKNDTCLILEGPQGSFKSSALEVLANPWFNDDMPQLGTKDAAQNLSGKWIHELSELDALRNAEVSSVKSFISRNSDHFRPSYGRYTVDVPRQCVFAGTCNHSDYLKDDTGGRRFWPVRCSNILLDVLQRDRDQLWAEAVHHFHNGKRWWLDSDDLIQSASAEQEARYNEDPWEPIISSYVYGKEYVTVSEILKYAIEKPEKDWNQQDKNRCAKSLMRLQWERYRASLENGRREWRYRPATICEQRTTAATS